MKINHLTESKRLPGQFGAQIISPEDFVKADEQGIDVDPNEQEVAEDKPQRDTNRLWQMITDYERRAKMSSSDIRKQHYMKMADELRSQLPSNDLDENRGYFDGMPSTENDVFRIPGPDAKPFNPTQVGTMPSGQPSKPPKFQVGQTVAVYMGPSPGVATINKSQVNKGEIIEVDPEGDMYRYRVKLENGTLAWVGDKRIKAAKHFAEATELNAPQKEFGDQEFQDYMTRIQGTPDIDKKTGLPKKAKDKISKKTGEVTPGAEKYISGKTKSDKFKMPYMHRSSIVTYYDAAGKRFREEDVINALKQRPKKLLKQNEKMKHSNGEFEQFFNIGFAALTGIAVDESTGKLIIVNTCPGAGSCKVDCFAMKGGKVQFKNAWLSDGKILTYLLNDPTGFARQLNAEIGKEAKDGQKGDKKFPGGWGVTIRWHDAGDFFSPEYLKLAFDIAKANPTVKFYAYTKMAGAALAEKPDNFIINWSEGAHTSQEKQVKQNDPNLEQTKNSRIVPEELFYDLLKKDAKGNLDKEGADAEGAGGRWVMRDEQATRELKQRLAKAYNISPNSILSYDEYTQKPKVAGMKYNVIVAPGEGDISANDPNVLSTLLLKH